MAGVKTIAGKNTVRKSLGHRSFGPCICCSTSPTSISRRSALSGISATAAVATASIFGRALPVLGETLPVEKTPLIDVHHHFAPPTYVAENRSKVSPAALDWTPQKALDAMDAEGVATAVLSLALLGVSAATMPLRCCQTCLVRSSGKPIRCRAVLDHAASRALE
jgi:hypothetical protein